MYPRNLADVGPISRILLASASPSIRGGGCVSFSFLTSLHVTRVGMHALPGGTMIRTPEWRQPRIAPPRASTMKLTKKLCSNINQHLGSHVHTYSCTILTQTSQILLEKIVLSKYSYGSSQKLYQNQDTSHQQNRSRQTLSKPTENYHSGKQNVKSVTFKA